MKKYLVLFVAILLMLCVACGKNSKNSISNLESSSTSQTEQNSQTVVASDSLVESDGLNQSGNHFIESEIDESLTLYASPNGTGDGSKDNPTSLIVAINTFQSKKKTTIVLESGEYKILNELKVTQKGTEQNKIKLVCTEGFATFNFEKTGTGMVLGGDFWHLYGIIFKNSLDNGIRISGNNNIVERCIACFNGDSGVQISGSTKYTIENWPDNNQIINCTSFGNIDVEGDDADGFACKITSGYGNSFDGCIAYCNSDDGWDLFTKRQSGVIGSVSLKNCIAFKNGLSIDENGVISPNQIGDGNGFKLGGRALEVDHSVDNCIAFLNMANGFDDNSNPGTITLTNCTAYNNGKRNMAMGRFTKDNTTYSSVWEENGVTFGPIPGINKSHNVFKNNISYSDSKTPNADAFVGNAENCYFLTSINGVTYFIENKTNVNSGESSERGVGINIENPFVSTAFEFDYLKIDELLRNDDGTVNLHDFLKVNSSYETVGAKF